MINDRDVDSHLLKVAVCEGNLKRVRNLIAEGVDAKSKSRWNGETLLHVTSDVEIAKELLLHGVHTESSNKYGETPLDTAVKRKNLEIVRELLKHRANVNTTNFKGNTPLNIAVKSRFKNFKLIKILLEYGADIYKKKLDVRNYTDPGTPLNNAMNDLRCVKLLIRYHLINNFQPDIQMVINLNGYKDHPKYNNLSNYLYDCVCEIVQMKTYEVKNNLTLYELIMMEHFNKPCNLQLYWKLMKFDDELFEIYPIYYEIIMDKLEPFTEKIYLLRKLRRLQIYVRINTSNPDDKKEKVILDPDSTYNIADYLFNDDLKNLIIAFDYLHFNSSNYTRRTFIQFNKTSTSCYHISKRMKFE
ncbi:hypothetical protein PV328_006200 [Microctonus aethiopoides]|uniref:Ankyrin repeat protein n=1 Tax=Microctonus aethiopoides TaxID=144406 RepID=A0AA39FNU4_9HYME|nr:hypothetical protein PV328_006200 [Microctonus aethiopoides]